MRAVNDKSECFGKHLNMAAANSYSLGDFFLADIYHMSVTGLVEMC